MSYAIPSLTRVPATEKGLTIGDFLVPIRVGERVSPRLRHVLLIVAGAVLIYLTAKVSIPIPGNPVPFTLQNFGVLVVGGALGLRRGGLRGAAVRRCWASSACRSSPRARAGSQVILGATGGYLIGFVLAAAVVGRLAELGWDRRIGGAIGATHARHAGHLRDRRPVARGRDRDVARRGDHRRPPPVPRVRHRQAARRRGRLPGGVVGGRTTAERPLTDGPARPVRPGLRPAGGSTARPRCCSVPAPGRCCSRSRTRSSPRASTSTPGFRDDPWSRLAGTLRSYLRIVYGTRTAALARDRPPEPAPRPGDRSRPRRGRRGTPRPDVPRARPRARPVGPRDARGLDARRRRRLAGAARPRDAVPPSTRRRSRSAACSACPDDLLPQDIDAFDAYMRAMLGPDGPVHPTATARDLARVILRPPLAGVVGGRIEELLGPAAGAVRRALALVPQPAVDALMLPAVGLLPPATRAEYGLAWGPLERAIDAWLVAGWRFWRPRLPTTLPLVPAGHPRGRPHAAAVMPRSARPARRLAGLALVATAALACGPAATPTPAVAAPPAGLDPGHVLVRVDRSPSMAPYDIVTPRLVTLTADGHLVTQDEAANTLMPPYREATLTPAQLAEAWAALQEAGVAVDATLDVPGAFDRETTEITVDDGARRTVLAIYALGIEDDLAAEGLAMTAGEIALRQHARDALVLLDSLAGDEPWIAPAIALYIGPAGTRSRRGRGLDARDRPRDGGRARGPAAVRPVPGRRGRRGAGGCGRRSRAAGRWHGRPGRRPLPGRHAAPPAG